MADYLTDAEIAEIERRWDGKNEASYQDAVKDVSRLVAEVRRLRAAEAAGEG